MIAVVTDYAPCIALRRAVFMDEQGISEAEEMDGLDEGAIHLLAHTGGKPVGTARILIAGDTGKIGRICVLRDHRGTGLGAKLVNAAIDQLRKIPHVSRAQLSAQDHAIGFYETLGFVAYGAFYDDAGIAHRDMARSI
ncbi:ElaA protein [Yoonia tamlensis]|uniref:ElaA protein n=1 Tax=Yoonia tamlensis TaxID=390270 RepID=A0A1I6FP41_9RHOB|nr:GNAT family N-acetyltransferase [Yoonia tamlensis]SFR31668.1 ElaA protein [Yoonia tamlensis]